MPLLRRRAITPDKPALGRQPIAKKDQDTLLTAIMTWIPIEVIAAYKFIMGIVPFGQPSWRFWLTVIMLLLTPLWIGFATKSNTRKIAWRQVLLAPFAFACWVAAIQEDVASLLVVDWQPWMGSVILGVGTILLPVLDGILKNIGFRQD